jgi:hypothetical protein
MHCRMASTQQSSEVAAMPPDDGVESPVQRGSHAPQVPKGKRSGAAGISPFVKASRSDSWSTAGPCTLGRIDIPDKLMIGHSTP